MEKRIEISTSESILEGILDVNSQNKAVVITHPHPLYGGNMENSVVHTIASVYKSKDYSTLRFNFRGVGGSSGSYNEGEGEQSDIESAISFFQKMGIQEIELAGYSFGAWVIHRLVCNKSLSNRVVMVSPPIDFLQFNEETSTDHLFLVVVGSDDQFVSSDRLVSVVSRWNSSAKLEIVLGADHFYSGHYSELAKRLSGL